MALEQVGRRSAIIPPGGDRSKREESNPKGVAAEALSGLPGGGSRMLNSFAAIEGSKKPGKPAVADPQAAVPDIDFGKKRAELIV